MGRRLQFRMWLCFAGHESAARQTFFTLAGGKSGEENKGGEPCDFPRVESVIQFTPLAQTMNCGS